MRWFFDNDHVFRVQGLTDNNGDAVTGATVTLTVDDRSGSEVDSFELSDDGDGDYSAVLDADTISDNDRYYRFRLDVQAGSLDGSWSELVKSVTRRFDE